MTSGRNVYDPKKQMSSELQDLEEAHKLIRQWQPASDVFALKNYPYAISALGSCTAAYINAHYRKAVRLRHNAFVSSLIPVVVLPPLVGTLLHHHFVQRPLLLQKFQCPVCIEIRAGGIQLFAGFIYPMVLAPLAAFQFAARLYTYPLPEVSQPKALFREFIKMTSPIKSKLFLLAGIQLAAGMLWTHWEAHNLFTVISKLSHMEEVVRKHHEEQKEKEDSVF
ncbi:transmembrane protein 126A-like [Penaeus japonicus]|uniref:transmembrane protein 126A-like n=1 Tax=Penaeus japonicus TaxID=27405 RepID=UPI001C712550|nr:transmembrane protein 126A-like [Penaeus japonicus]XP_042858814.1 transmembrane protein 126A-like [Penaeus japonicus]